MSACEAGGPRNALRPEAEGAEDHDQKARVPSTRGAPEALSAAA